MKVGDRFARLLVLSLTGSTATCACDCGETKEIHRSSLTGGRTRSCGCYNREVSSRPKSHGMSYCREQSIWIRMKARCRNEKLDCYKNYGARGIFVCREWESFEQFYKDMGPCPPGFTIERKDNNKGYEPGNCKWASRREQNRNTRANHRIEFNGQTRILSDWADSTGLKRETIAMRLKHGWSIHRALTQPARKRSCKTH